jgi:hypothetical protein
MKKALIVGLVATGIMVGSGVTTSPSAFAATGGTARPITVRSHQTGTIDLATFSYNLAGPGIGSHIGKGVVTASGDMSGGTTVTTAANGDTFTAGNIVVVGIPVCPPDLPFGSISDEEIIGGTGRFAGATGTVRVTSCAGFPGGVFTADSVVTGTISY